MKKRIKQKLLILGGLLLFSWSALLSQVSVGTIVAPESGAILQLREDEGAGANSSKGLLLPRVLLTTANSMAPVIASPTTTEKEEHIGLTVYHVGNINLCAGIYTWSGEMWEALMPCKASAVCSSAQFNGTYQVGTPLNSATNTLTVDITVPRSMVGGTYIIYTNEVNGMSFSKTGTLTTGTSTITLNGSGTPQSGGSDNTFTIMFDYSNGDSDPANCSAVLPSLPVGKAKISGFGLYNSGVGYYAGLPNVGSRLLIDRNFGTSSTLFDGNGFDYITPIALDGLTPSNFLSTTTWQANPDILINGFHSHTVSTQVIDSLMAYLNRGGVLIMFDEYGNGAYSGANITYQLCNRLFPTSTIGFTLGGTSGSTSTILNNVEDEIANGPFGPIQGLTWGHDASSTVAFTGLPQDSIIVYSTGEYINPVGQQQGSQSAVSMFRHKRLNLFFCGDGGFLANPATGVTGSEPIVSSTICPFAVRFGDYYPIPRIRWGYNSSFTVYNSQIFANIMDWAMKNAKSNKKK